MSIKPEDEFIIIPHIKLPMSLSDQQLAELEKKATDLHLKAMSIVAGNPHNYDPIQVLREAREALEELDRLKATMT